MKEIKVTVNTWYVVEGAAGATVINPLTNRAIATVEDGKQASFLATTPYVVASDDSVNVFKAPFNSAPAKLKLLGLLGGGSSTGLPSGYLAALFLESSGVPYIKTNIPAYNTDVSLRLRVYEAKTRAFCAMYNLSSNADGEQVQIFCEPSRGLRKMSMVIFGRGANNASKLIAALPVETDSNPYTYTCEISWSERVIRLNNVETGTSVEKTWSSDKPPVFVYEKPSLFLFARNNASGDNNGSPAYKASKCHIFSFKANKGDIALADFIPCLDEKGRPLFYDKVSGQQFYNSATGEFIIGFSLEQARKLRKLPKSGGNLAISLPSNYTEDAEVMEALAMAEANGWVFEYRTYDDTATVSTFALRRIYVRYVQDDLGNYVNADGVRYRVEWCEGVLGAEPEALGYELFRSVAAATEYWGLEPYADPNWEEDFLT